MRWPDSMSCRMIWVSKSNPSLLRSNGSWRSACDRVGPVPGVPLGQLDSRHGVLDRGEDPVADVLVHRHAAAPRAALDHHPGTEHGIGVVREQRRDHVGQQLGGVLPVAVQQHDDVEVLLDRRAVAPLLVAAVAEVLVVADHLQGHLRPQLLVAHRDEVGLVLAVVVTDDDRGDRVAEVRGDPVEHGREGGRGVVRDHQDPDPLARHVPSVVDGATLPALIGPPRCTAASEGPSWTRRALPRRPVPTRQEAARSARAAVRRRRPAHSP